MKAILFPLYKWKGAKDKKHYLQWYNSEGVLECFEWNIVYKNKEGKGIVKMVQLRKRMQWIII